MFASIWAFVQDPGNRAVLGWISGGIVVVIGGFRAAFKFFFSKEKPKAQLVPTFPRGDRACGDGDSADRMLCTATVLVEEAEAIRGHQINTMDCKAIYRELNGLGSVALCLSGGGIRSAAFSLGVVQALASTPCVAAPAKANGSSAPLLLERFHYLSTVSGGGYLGSWLSTWLSRTRTG